MPIKSKAQRRKFAELLVEGKIEADTYERWNREAGSRELPERVRPKSKAAKRKKTAKAARKRKRVRTTTRATKTRRAQKPKRAQKAKRAKRARTR
jgi:hypothetical protein